MVTANFAALPPSPEPARQLRKLLKGIKAWRISHVSPAAQPGVIGPLILLARAHFNCRPPATAAPEESELTLLNHWILNSVNSLCVQRD